MKSEEALKRMVAPGTKRRGKWRGGILQVMVTRACDRACCHCTQGSNLGGKPVVMPVEQFEAALDSLQGYWGVVGIFGGNPCMHPEFPTLCSILRSKVPWEQRGLWSNHPLGHGDVCRKTFNPAVSNLNVHQDEAAFAEFYRDWPESRQYLKGLKEDSRHSPPFVAMQDVVRKLCPACEGTGKWYSNQKPTMNCLACDGTGTTTDDDRIWELISGCDINQHWSAMVCTTPYGLRAFFCEIAGAQAMLHPEYPDTGMPAKSGWWRLPMEAFAEQVEFHCFKCGIPLRRFGELANGGNTDEVSATHAAFKAKRKDRKIALVTVDGGARVPKVTRYIENGAL